VRIEAREGETRCPYCREALEGAAASCATCRTGYHLECAQLFGACAVYGCAGALEQAHLGAVGQALPRVGALARRLGADDAAAAAGGPLAVVLDLPAEGMPRRATDVVAAILGQTAFDARQRLATQFPETLVRCADADEAERVRRRLAGVGLRAITVPLVELLRPLDLLRPATLDLDDAAERLVARDAEGRVRRLRRDRPWLLVEGVLCTREPVSDDPGGLGAGRGYDSLGAQLHRSQTRGAQGGPRVRTNRFKLRPKTRKRRQQAALLYAADADAPLAIRALEHTDYGLLPLGPRSPSQTQRFLALLDRFAELAPLTRCDLGPTVANLLRSRPDGSADNEAALGVIGRLRRRLWLADGA